MIKENKLKFTAEEVNKKNKNGQTFLIMAMEACKHDNAEVLIRDLGANVNERYGKDGDTAMHLACLRAAQDIDPEKQKDREKMVELLLKYGANYNALNKNL